MKFSKSFLFIAASYLSVTSASSLDSDLKDNTGNGNYIIQLNHTTCIKHFVPQFVDSAFDIFNRTMGAHKIHRKSQNRIVRRDTNEDQIHVFDAYQFGDTFKAITVKFDQFDVINALASTFTQDIVKVVHDYDIDFDLHVHSVHKRDNTVSRRNAASRVGNFDYDTYKHDENCPYRDSDLQVAADKKRAKRASITGAAACTAGSSGKKNGDGYNGYCCTSSNDCKDTCVKGKCNGPFARTTKKTRTTTTKTKAASTCIAGSSGKKKSNGYLGYCCTSSNDCRGTCVRGKCNGAAAPTKTTKKTTTAKTTGTNTSYTSQTKAQWGLVRTSEHALSLSKPYIYDSTAGAGVTVYVIDDGLNIHHHDFEGRASWGYSVYSGISILGEGHGTHVAGIIGSKTYGVAKKSDLIAVQVLDSDGKGSVSSLLSGIQWVTSHASSKKGKAVINMSLAMQTAETASSTLSLFNNALSAAVNSGIPIFAAAGNWATDSCDVLPASNPHVFAVAASDDTDTFAEYSCYGSCVSLVAPGTDIKSTYIKSNSSTATLSGTSMASPHAAGVAALILADVNNTTPTSLYQKIKSMATSNKITDFPDKKTPNLLLFNGQKLTTM